MSSQSEEVEDYMSDGIINSCLQSDIRPGLLHSHASKRTHAIQKRKVVTDKKNKEKNPKKSALESERRDEGLSEALNSTNKGFAMLQKMGYKPGTAIGKDSSGIVEPVPLVIKVGRQGLGRQAAIKEIQAQRLLIRARHLKKLAEATDADSYRQRLSQQAAEKQTLTDLHQSQRVCEQLDLEQGIAQPEFRYFWPERQKEEVCADEDEEIQEGSAVEEPEIKEEYLKEEYLHQSKDEPSQSHEEKDDDFEPSEQLEILTMYLRRSFCYCVWCGIKFEGEEDLNNSCPGATRDDH